MADHSDELLRSVKAAAGRASTVESSLKMMTDVDLFSALGQRISDSSINGRTPALDTHIDIDDLVRSSAMEELGRRVFYRWSLALHQFVCNPSSDDQDLREKILQALSGKDGGAVALIAGVMVAAFGASPAIAAIVATLLVRLLLNPAREELCAFWSEKLHR